jgi:hypothetical protein
LREKRSELGKQMISVVVDVDDTLISTERRMQAVWRELLGCEVPLEVIETLGLEQIFMKYASSEQKARVSEFQKRFWDIVLCLEEVGVELLELHRPVPFGADVLQEWSNQCRLVYLTGRTINTRKLTFAELKKFGFPVDDVALVMFSIEDYDRARGLKPSGSTLVDAKSRLFSLISSQHNVVRAIDDYPGYFPIYRKFNVSDRIGLLRPKRYKPQQYKDEGATRVIRSWKELEDDPPKPF